LPEGEHEHEEVRQDHGEAQDDRYNRLRNPENEVGLLQTLMDREGEVL
jgi:hypothetical protein